MAKTPAPVSQANLLEQYQTWDEVAPPSEELVKKRLQDAFVNRHWDIIDYHKVNGHSIDMHIETRFRQDWSEQLKAASVHVEYNTWPEKKKLNIAEHLPSLIIAVLDDDADRVKWLLARGVPVDQSSYQYNASKTNTALLYALALGKNHAARALLAAGAQPDYKSAWGATPQLAAERTGNVLGAAMAAYAVDHMKKTREPLTEEALTSVKVLATVAQFAALQPPAPAKGWGAKLADSFRRALKIGQEEIPQVHARKPVNTNLGAVM